VRIQGDVKGTDDDRGITLGDILGRRPPRRHPAESCDVAVGHVPAIPLHVAVDVDRAARSPPFPK
jgi:hypothetical protein